MFIAMSGISASGKNTVMQKLIERRPNAKVLLRSSCTTRPPRESDGDFQTYLYLTKEEFERGIAEGRFIEYELVHDNYYGTVKAAFEEVIAHPENEYIRDIDVKGTENIKKYLAGKAKVVTIFLDAPDDVLAERLRARGESPEKIALRLSRGGLERSYKDKYDLVIENIDLNTTLQIINDFIDKRRGSK